MSTQRPVGPVVNRATLADVRYVVERWRPRWGEIAEGYRVLRNGELRYLGADLARTLRWLHADLEASVAGTTAALTLRAAVVFWRDRAIVICGPQGGGTSTLAAALVACGARPWADGHAIIDGGGRVCDPSGAASPTLPVALVVSTYYRRDARWEPRRVGRARAALSILESAVAEAVEVPRLLRSSARLAAAALALQGVRAEAPQAAPEILAALDEWLDGGRVAPHEPHADGGFVGSARRALVAARTARERSAGAAAPSADAAAAPAAAEGRP